MKHICPNCLLEFDGRKNKEYCSVKCRERQRFLRRKDNPQYKKKRAIREKRWYLKGGKKKKNEYQHSKRFRNYQNKWRREKKVWLKQYINNAPARRDASKKYRRTSKGKINTLKCNERRRKKNILLTGKALEKLNSSFIKKIRKRDKVCVYCKTIFDETSTLKRETFDHFDCNKPLSLNNTVRCCWSCNSSKRNVPLDKLDDWIKRKGFNPTPIVIKLLKKHL